MPRFQVGFPPQHLLLALLGDYWSGRCEPLPSAALVDLLAEFDVNPSGARAALSRLSIRGLLVGTKDGRNTFYRVADGFRNLLPYGPIHTRAFAKPKPVVGRHVDDGGVHRAGGSTQGPSDAARSTAVAGFCAAVRRIVGVASCSRHGARHRLADRAAAVVHGDSRHRTADENTVGGRVGLEPRRPRSVVRRVHPHVSAGSAPPGGRPDGSDRGAGQPHTCDIPMVRVRGHGS